MTPILTIGWLRRSITDPASSQLKLVFAILILDTLCSQLRLRWIGWLRRSCKSLRFARCLIVGVFSNPLTPRHNLIPFPNLVHISKISKVVSLILVPVLLPCCSDSLIRGLPFAWYLYKRPTGSPITSKFLGSIQFLVQFPPMSLQITTRSKLFFTLIAGKGLDSTVYSLMGCKIAWTSKRH